MNGLRKLTAFDSSLLPEVMGSLTCFRAQYLSRAASRSLRCNPKRLVPVTDWWSWPGSAEAAQTSWARGKRSLTEPLDYKD